MAFLNSLLSWAGPVINMDFITSEWLLTVMFTPLAFLMGVQWEDCGVVGELIGIKTFANEFIAFLKLAPLKGKLNERSVTIATYALCGFSHLGSVGIMLGSLGSLYPGRKGHLAKMSIQALCAGACFLTACVAGERESVKKHIGPSRAIKMYVD
ncbi:sodium/nucleoside cotransporter 2-like [Ixodes scapularis]